ncbi:MAG: GatB/YqeY domain-containing protein [Bacteroidales bacterium]|jgi:uncharacterized protein YqeY|nr:GatB/YqeY domain-containing protein [Bacteroidales bacterium]MBR5249556.1 GatB/YqeY domain-containing protein [Bacteroidales bacterium]
MEQKIQAEIKAAMLAKNSVRLAALRGVKAAILLAKTAEGASGELSDGDILKIIQKLVKQRKESAAIYTEQNRPDLAEAELAEVQELEGFLPKALTEEEIEAKVREVIAQVGASSMADMGKVMGVATKQLAGQADGRAISAAVKKCLS